MKIYVVTISFKRRIDKNNKERSGVLYRPAFMCVSEFDTKTRKYKRHITIPLQYEHINKEIAEKLIDKNSRIVVWNEDDQTILHTLLQEAGYNSGKLKFIPIRRYLKQHGIPDKSLSITANALGLGTCPRDGVTSHDKVFERFDTLRKIFKKIIIIDGLDLIDGILI